MSIISFSYMLCISYISFLLILESISAFPSVNPNCLYSLKSFSFPSFIFFINVSIENSLTSLIHSNPFSASPSFLAKYLIYSFLFFSLNISILTLCLSFNFANSSNKFFLSSSNLFINFIYSPLVFALGFIISTSFTILR